MLKRIKKKSVIWNWLLSYMIVLMIPMISVFINYSVNVKTIRQGLMDANALICQNLQNSIESYLQEEESASNWIFGNEKMWSVSRSKEKTPFFYYAALELQKQLTSYCQDKEELRCMVYFAGTDYIITDDTGNESRYYYNKVADKLPEGMDYESWMEKLGEDYRKRFFVTDWTGNASGEKTLTYANSFYTAGERVNVIISIPLKYIERQVEYLKEGMFLILGLEEEYLFFNNEGIISCPAAVQIGEDGTLYPESGAIMCKAQSDTTEKGVYFLLTTAQQMENDLKETRNSFVLNLGMMIVFGMISIGLLCFQNYQPMRKLFQKIESVEGTNNEFEQLEYFVEKMQEEKQETNKLLKRQRENLVAGWLLAAMKGRRVEFPSEEHRAFFQSELQGKIALAGFMLPEEDSEKLEYDELMFFIIDNVFEELMAEKKLYHIEDGCYVFYLLDLSEERSEDWQSHVLECVDYVCNLLKEKCDVNLAGVVSESAESMEYVTNLYRNVLTALEYKKLIGEKQIVTTDNGEYKKNREGIVSQIQRYVEENYADSNLNVNSVADAFSRNQKYISRIFKEETGEGLLSYINNLRIAKAEELIREDGERTLEEIAQAVGFNNERTFRRARNRAKSEDA